MQQYNYYKPAPNVDATEKQRGLMTSKMVQFLNAIKAKVDAATSAPTPLALAMRDAAGNLAFVGVNSGYHTGWTTVSTFANNWTHQPASPQVQYMRDALGWLHLSGVAYKTAGVPASQEVMFTLPVGFRPLRAVELGFAATNSGGGQVNVHTTGEVRWVSGGTSYFSLLLPPLQVATV